MRGAREIAEDPIGEVECMITDVRIPNTVKIKMQDIDGMIRENELLKFIQLSAVQQ